MFKDNVFHGLSCQPLISEQFKTENPQNPRDVAPVKKCVEMGKNVGTGVFLSLF